MLLWNCTPLLMQSVCCRFKMCDKLWKQQSPRISIKEIKHIKTGVYTDASIRWYTHVEMHVGNMKTQRAGLSQTRTHIICWKRQLNNSPCAVIPPFPLSRHRQTKPNSEWTNISFSSSPLVHNWRGSHSLPLPLPPNCSRTHYLCRIDVFFS